MERRSVVSQAVWYGVLLATLISGCQAQAPQKSYWSLMKEPMPTSNEARDTQCARLRGEITRMQTMQQMVAPGPSAIMLAAKMRDNIAALESRRSQIQCDVIRVAPTEAVVPQRTDFDQCFAKCRSVTSRSENECFDACK